MIDISFNDVICKSLFIVKKNISKQLDAAIFLYWLLIDLFNNYKLTKINAEKCLNK